MQLIALHPKKGRLIMRPRFIARFDVMPVAVDVSYDAHTVHIALADGRRISAPLSWFPRLAAATQSERCNWQLLDQGIGIHWPDIDEDISIESLLAVR
jgi:hypothetical protein